VIITQLLAMLSIVFVTLTSPFHEMSELLEELPDHGQVVDVHMPFCPPHDKDGPNQKHPEVCHLLMRLATQAATELAPFIVPPAPHVFAAKLRFRIIAQPPCQNNRVEPFQPRAPPLAAT
jgi:hypothetical protein